MIKLSISGYCHECPEFEPETDLIVVDNYIGERIIENRVICMHRDRCRSIVNYLTKKIEEESKATK